MDQTIRTDLEATVRHGGEASIRNLAEAEAAVLRGQFNLAKLLRAVAHAQRVQVALQTREACATQVQERIDELLQRARTSLLIHGDVPESVVAQHLWGCYGCGYVVEGNRPENCPLCGALGVEFEWFGPFYTATSEHLGQLGPASILAVLAAVPDEVASLLATTSNAVLRRKPSDDDWCVMEIVGHMLETDLLFAWRLRTVLSEQGMPYLDTPIPPWKLHEGKGYQDLPLDDLPDRLRQARAASLVLIRDLTPEQWARRGILRGTSTSILDLGTWLANHDRGHLAQVRRLCAYGRDGLA